MTPTERSALDRDELVRAGLKLLDEVGLEGLTMRSLAERLGVKAASLYWHIRDKDELAELLLEAINSEIRDPDPRLPWRELLEQLALEWRRVLLLHRDSARLAMGRFVARPATLRRIELVVGALRQAGFTDEDAANAAYLMSNFVPGFVAEETMERPAVANRPEAPTPSAVPPLERARLEVGSAQRLTITADPSLTELYDVYGHGPAPEIFAANGVVNLLQTRGRKPTRLVLSASIPWQILVNRGVSHLTADLRGLQLTAFEVHGGASAVELTVPLPTGTVPIQLTGGTSKLNIHRPAEAAVRLDVRGGISRLTFDHRPFPSAGALTVQSPGYDRVTDRYEVTLTGGASRIEVDAAMPPASPDQPEDRTPNPAHQAFTSLSPAEYPNLAALSSRLLSQSMDDRFRFGVRVVLDGLERRLHSAR